MHSSAWLQRFGPEAGNPGEVGGCTGFMLWGPLHEFPAHFPYWKGLGGSRAPLSPAWDAGSALAPTAARACVGDRTACPPGLLLMCMQGTFQRRGGRAFP